MTTTTTHPSTIVFRVARSLYKSERAFERALHAKTGKWYAENTIRRYTTGYSKGLPKNITKAALQLITDRAL